MRPLVSRCGRQEQYFIALLTHEMQQEVQNESFIIRSEALWFNICSTLWVSFVFLLRAVSVVSTRTFRATELAHMNQHVAGPVELVRR